jgi:archaellum component FlaC
MKNVLILMLLVAIIAAVGYLGLPVLIEKKTAGLRSEVAELRQKVQRMEDESKAAPLLPDTDVRKVIKTVNALSYKVSALEESLNKNMSAVNETLKKQKITTEETLKKQAESLDKSNKEIQGQIQRMRFDNAIEDVRGHILKIKLDFASKNIGTAKNELGLVDENFERLKAAAHDDNKKMIADLQGILKKARAEIDVDLTSAANNIDLLWHEIGKLMRKD